VTGQEAGEVLKALTAEASSPLDRRWGEAPALHFVYLQYGRAWMETPPIPALAWGRQPDQALYTLAEAAAAARISPMPGLFAVAFRAEAIYAEARGGAPQPGHLARSAAAGVARHVDMRTVRTVMAVDRVGNRYEVTVFRDTGETRTGIHPRSKAAYTASGRALPALDLMIRAYLGVDLPPPCGVSPPEPGL